MRLKRALPDENGSVMVIAMILMIVALALGFTAVAATNSQTHQAGHETAGEAAFNLAESALDAQARVVQLHWPGTTPSATTCNQASTPSSTCAGTTVTSGFASSYAGQEYSNPTWSTQVGGVCPTSNLTCTTLAESASYYSDPIPATAMGCDCYSANAVWLRSQATILGQKRIVVGEIQRQGLVISLPDTTITAGGVNTSNQGNKVIIEQSDTAGTGLTGAIDLTCGTSTTQPQYQSGCAGWDSGKTYDQASPGTYNAGYSYPNGSSVLTPAQLESLETTATESGTTPPAGTCPSNWNGLVYIPSTPPGGCVIPKNTSYNGCSSPPPSSATPGMIIVGSGSLEMGANVCYYGVIYMVNTGGPQPSGGVCTSTDPVLTLDANSNTYGGVFSDNCGLVTVGQSSGITATVYFDSLAFTGATAYDTPVLAKNTFRILPNN